MLSWLVYLGIGKLFIFLWGKFPLPKSLEKYNTINQLHNCGLCAGVWIYSALAFFLGMDLLSVLGFSYVPLVSEVITGGATSFVVHLLSLGWNDQFSVVVE